MKKKTVNIFSISLFFLTFIIGLLSFVYSKQYEIIESKKSLKFSYKYFLLPAIILSSHLSYIVAFKYKKNLKKWFKIISFPAFFIPVSLIYMTCFGSISIFLNEKIGQQNLITIKSKIIEIEKSKNKSFFYITLENNTKYRVNKDLYFKYSEKEIFNETLWKGSFNFYYRKIKTISIGIVKTSVNKPNHFTSI